MTDTLHDLIVVGGGQAGLATAFHATRRGWKTLILEAGPAPTGSWPRFYDSLTLFSPARHSSLPGMPFPGDPGRYPQRDEVVEYLAKYAAGLDAQIAASRPATSATWDAGVFTVSTPDRVFQSRRVVNATGGFATPHRPELPGLDGFFGTVLHSAEYVAPQTFSGQHVVVVGAGNSAVQIATELATTAKVTLTSRHPVKFLPQRPFGRDIHDWLHWTRLGHGRPSLLLKRGVVAVLDDGHHQRALQSGNPLWRPMFTRLDRDQARWADGSAERVDVVLLATGFRPALSHLDGLYGASGASAVDRDGVPLHRQGVSHTVAGLGFVGLEWQRGFASATLRGVGPDAAHVLRRLR
ncbi:flavin-containing monooxygenase [Catelliglobosispora koreensis]|uniref:flavin-containing monooxygenase n=1 Tax=Catelliglobosispora koreensis TaxID=129052 RepID=UPI000363BC9F|nr:NAD(P)/FAD-dependent oxidoreductase [Catelliglobosispora koreensis]